MQDIPREAMRSPMEGHRNQNVSSGPFYFLSLTGQRTSLHCWCDSITQPLQPLGVWAPMPLCNDSSEPGHGRQGKGQGWCSSCPLSITELSMQGPHLGRLGQLTVLRDEGKVVTKGSPLSKWPGPRRWSQAHLERCINSDLTAPNLRFVQHHPSSHTIILTTR